MRPYYQIVSLSQIYSIHLLVAGSHPEKPANTAHIEPFYDKTDYLYRYRYMGWKLKQWKRSCRFTDYFRYLIKGDGLSFVTDSGDLKHLRHDKTLVKIANMKFDRVHVFRLYLNSISEILKGHGLKSFYSLDIDDIESEARKSISRLFSRNRDFMKALRLKRESIIYFNMETKSIPAYDQIFTCSHHDKDMLQNRFPDKVVTVLPNVVPIPTKAAKKKTNQVLTILFVGTMGYFPNFDAIQFFTRQIAPVLRKKSPMPWNLRIVGMPPQKNWLRKLKHFPEINFSGFVKDLYPEYEAADIVVAPIRGGGGTRIKILEAFAHGVPVVSTSKGAEGLNVENGIHLLIEDNPDLFAHACIRLMNDPLLRDEMSRRAFDLAASQYHPDMIKHIWTKNSPHESRS